jgi:hypothetical protein
MIARFLAHPGVDDVLRARIAAAVSATSPLTTSARPASLELTRALSRASSSAGGAGAPFSVDTSTLLALLRAHPLFASADASALETIARGSERAEWVSGDVIVRAGDGFCVLLERGAAGVFDDRDSLELPTVTLGAGDDCGVAHLLYPNQHAGGGETRALAGGATGFVLREDLVLSVMLEAVEAKRREYGPFLRGLPPLALLEDAEILRLADFTTTSSFVRSHARGGKMAYSCALPLRLSFSLTHTHTSPQRRAAANVLPCRLSRRAGSTLSRRVRSRS